MLLAARRDCVLLIGQGTGVTAGELARWPEIASIDLVELSPAVVRALPLFGEQTGHVEDDPRLRVHVQDAVHFLRGPGPSWDVVISEPNNVWNGGNDLLFTDAFFRSLERRLAPGGVLLQWMHLFETDETILRRTLASLASVVPELIAFRGTDGDWIVLASRRPLRDVDSRLAGAYRDHAFVRDALADLPVEDVAALPYRGARARYRGELLNESELLRRVATSRANGRYAPAGHRARTRCLGLSAGPPSGGDDVSTPSGLSAPGDCSISIEVEPPAVGSGAGSGAGSGVGAAIAGSVPALGCSSCPATVTTATTAPTAISSATKMVTIRPVSFRSFGIEVMALPPSCPEPKRDGVLAIVERSAS